MKALFQVNLFDRTGSTIIQSVVHLFVDFPLEYLPQKGDTVDLINSVDNFKQTTVGKRTLVCDVANPSSSFWEIYLKTQSVELIDKLRRMGWR